MKKTRTQKGFTLVEIIVAIAVFTFVLFISTSSIYSIFDANRKSQNTRTVMDSLDNTLESITRNIRFGTNYHCDITTGIITNTRDCATGASSMALLDSTGTQVQYRLNGASIERSINGGVSYVPLTSSDVTITNLTFWVLGSSNYSSGDKFQPEVILVVGGYAGTKATSKTSFTLETTISERMVDSQ